MDVSISPEADRMTLVVAHPDDESIFFFQVLKFLRPRRLRLVCVTGNFGPETATRQQEFAESAEALGGEVVCLGLADHLNDRALDVSLLRQRLEALPHDRGSPVLTHGPVGEYGHRHHVDTFLEVYRRFREDVWCVSGPLEPHLQIHGERADKEIQRAHLRAIYRSQGKAWRYASGYECLTHVHRSAWAGLLNAVVDADRIPPDKAEAFWTRLLEAYAVEAHALPPECAEICRVEGLEWLRSSLWRRLDDWSRVLRDRPAPALMDVVVRAGQAYISQESRTKPSETGPTLNYYPRSWELQPDRCPCDLHLLEYMKARDCRDRSIFHFGTGSHHVLGKRNLTFDPPNEILGVTASVSEYQSYMDLIIENPRVATYYKVMFADIYTLSRRVLPTFDVITLFHLCEYYDDTQREYCTLDDESLLALCIDRLNPGGKILLYRGSFRYERAASIINEFVARNRLRRVEDYESLVVFELPGAGVARSD
jgi:hypothetical protein